MALPLQNAPDVTREPPGVVGSPPRSLRRRAAIPLGIAALALLHHTAIALQYVHSHHVPFGEAICRWDCALYADLSQHGYHGALWAFLPLFPTLTGMLSAASGMAPVWTGSLLSAACLGLFVLLLERYGRSLPDHALLVPETSLGWFLFLYSPASYVLTSNHTESLFLLLSGVAFVLAARGRAGLSGLFAGASVWTRNQGVFVAIACALLAATTVEGRGPRARRFLLAGAVSFVLFALLLAFEAHGTGNPLAFVAAEQHWTHPRSAMDVVRALWLGNPWQNHGFGSVIRLVYFVGLAVLTWRALRRRAPLGIYALLSIGVFPLQGELINDFRYSAVIFPLFFLAGDRLARTPRWVQVPAILAVIALNHWVTHCYVSHRWAY